MVDVSLLHPRLRECLPKILAAMEALGFPMKMVQGARTVEEQQALYAQGRTAPGPIVTNCDGVVKLSNHQIQADGFGHAVDCAFDGPEPFSETAPWGLYGMMGQALGLHWGGGHDFIIRGINDRPHLEV